MRDDGEVRSGPTWVDIGERCVPTEVADGVHVDRGGSLDGPGIVEVLEDRDADLRCRLEAGPHEGFEVLHLRSAYPEHVQGATPVRLDRGVRPPPVPRFLPLIEVRPGAPCDEAPVV